MQLWQYNAWREAFQLKQIDNLSLQIQAAYYGAYWNSATKHKKSPAKVIKELYKSVENKAKRKKIDIEKVSKQFRQMEELMTNGWYKQ